MSAENAMDAVPGAGGGLAGPAARVRRGVTRLDLRRLGRAALLGAAGGRGRLPDALEGVAQAHRAHHPRADLGILRRAYLLAESSHRGQRRKSGEPYITHPLAVTLILAQLGAETTTLTASLLHDTVEDTDVTLDQVGAEFGAEVRYLVDGVTKLEKVDYGAAAEPETFRKMLVATGNDVRVMSIKLADRLHNMRTLGVMRPDKQVRIAKVTRDVLIPLAERLGVQALKTELEDLVFAILHPEEYGRARELMVRHAELPDPLLRVAEEVRGVLRDAGIAAEVDVRARHVLSVHRAGLKRGTPLGGNDFGRLLVRVAEDADCYAVLGELHTCFTPVISEFKDFIAAPKFNLYQSLHTAVAGRDGSVTEILVRSRRMHRVAEAGVIALGNPYAQPGEDGAGPGAGAGSGERSDPTRPGWLSRLLEWQREAPDPETFWSALRDDLAGDGEITVFSADGGTIGLPAAATCVDAAYAVYGEGAHACVGARVNGRLASLGSTLRDGDTLHLLMAAGSEPSPGWLDNARTPAARIAISRWLAAHPAPSGPPAAPPAAGDPAAAAARAHEGTAEPCHSEAAHTAPAAPGLPGHGVRPAGTAGTADTGVEGGAAPVPPAPANPGTGGPGAARRSRGAGTADPVTVSGLPGAAVRLARCCTPVPPDAVTGFLIRGGMVAVHRSECGAVSRMTSAGRTPRAVRWCGQAPPSGYRLTLRAEALNRPHLLADLTEAISGEGVGIVSAAVEPPQEHRVRHTYTVELPEAAVLPGLMRAMRAVDGVYDVYRTQHHVAASG